MHHERFPTPISANIDLFRKEFTDGRIGLPIPFMRRDLMAGELGYTDGSENRHILYPPSMLAGLPGAELTDLLYHCGSLVPAEIVNSTLGLSQRDLAEIASFADSSQLPLFIGSSVRYLYLHFCNLQNEFLPRDAVSHFRANYKPGISDFDFRVTPEMLEKLGHFYPDPITESRTDPGAKKIRIVSPNSQTKDFLTFPVSNQLIGLLSEPSDFSEGIFALVTNTGALLLQDAFGARLMQPYCSTPPYPENITTEKSTLRTLRNAVRMAVTTTYSRHLVNYISNLTAETEFSNPGKFSNQACDSINEAFLAINAQSRQPDRELAVVLGQTGLTRLLVHTGLTGKNLRVLEEIYFSYSEMFTRIPAADKRFITIKNFYRGHITQISPEELITACKELSRFPESFFDNLNLDKNSCIFSGDSRDILIKKLNQEAETRNHVLIQTTPGLYLPHYLPWPEPLPFPLVSSSRLSVVSSST